MSFSDYTAFRLEVSSFLARSDLGDTTTTGRVDAFIDLFEADWNQSMRVRQMEGETTITSTAGYLVHPTDWLGWQNVGAVQGGITYNLRPLTSEQVNMLVRGITSINDSPIGIEVIGDKTYIRPTTGAGAYTYATRYWQKLTALDGTNTTNWLLTGYPEAYLYGTCLRGAVWLNTDPQTRADWLDAYQMQVSRIQNASELANMSGMIGSMLPDRVF